LFTFSSKAVLSRRSPRVKAYDRPFKECDAMKDLTRREAMAVLSAGVTAGSINPLWALPDERAIPSQKKGLGLAIKHNPDYGEKLSKLNVNWFYNWNWGEPKDTPKNVEHIPMVWGHGNRFDRIVEKLMQRQQAGEIDTLLGFNEPDKKSQSNISVDAALKAWPKLMETGLRLGSPGCVHADRPWMQEFMRKATERNYRVDFICVHRYGGANPDGLINHLKKIRKMYRLPIWITEFAVGDWQAKSAKDNKHRPEDVFNFMKGVIPRLEGLPWLERYAWFPAGQDNAALGTSALWDEDGNFTRLGQLYASA
jgi:hypothetical protein